MQVSSLNAVPDVPDCPFYSRTIVPQASEFFISGGNRCALIMDAHSPCLAAIRPPGSVLSPATWTECPRNPGNNGTGRALLYERLGQQ